MTATEARAILAAISGYWPTPAITEEEAAAWLRELASPMRITSEEARTVIDDRARAGVEFRLRPGQLVSEVQALRRYRRLMTPLPALPAPSFVESEDHDEIRAQTLAQWRAAVADGPRLLAERRARNREAAV
jgi:hypothetical protein